MMTRTFRKQWPFHLMILPGALLVFVYCYIPMIGNVLAFQKFMPGKGVFGSKWVGLANFEYMLKLPDIGQVIYNTVFIATVKAVLGLIVPIVIALLLNEMAGLSQKVVQTMIYLPNFLSWVILGGVLIDILSPESGIVGRILKLVGIEPIYFLGDNKWFPFTLIFTDVWKNFGFSTVIFLAAITTIDIGLYEAARADGAGYFRRAIHITLPGMAPIIVLVSLLSLGRLLNAGFDQIFNLYSPIVYKSGDIIDTYVYRLGLVDARYDLATAVGLFKSLVSFVLISVSYYSAYKAADYRVF